VFLNFARPERLQLMPQFDSMTFYSQIFWLTIIFFGFYNYVLRTFLPKISAVLKTRKKKMLLGSDVIKQYNGKQISEKWEQNKSIKILTNNLYYSLVIKNLKMKASASVNYDLNVIFNLED
jgi:F0F1-type ATP synthase membrane subunit b/b'